MIYTCLDMSRHTHTHTHTQNTQTHTHTRTPQDVTLTLAAQGIVRAHRSILCARCSYFRDVLNKEGGGGGGGGAVITMTDASEAAMSVVLQYL
jgi:hypothetical protein